MDTDQLKNVLSRDLGSSFGGVYPVDLIPDHLISNQKAIVINLDPHYKPGSHWVCLYLSGNRVEYFDSYGLPPFSKNIKVFIDKNSKDIHYNQRRYQDFNTDVCGQYCVYFLHERHRRGPMALDRLFPENWKPKQTDRIVFNWFNQSYRKPKTRKGQCCKTFKENCICWKKLGKDSKLMT